jgi:hypothetical protein
MSYSEQMSYVYMRARGKTPRASARLDRSELLAIERQQLPHPVLDSCFACCSDTPARSSCAAIRW